MSSPTATRESLSLAEVCSDTDKDSWSPLHELIPDPPLRHGHAISIDMAFSATLSLQRGLLSPSDHTRLLKLFSRAGLSMDHSSFDAPLLERATAAILRTRDGKLRAAVPVSPLGKCVFLNDVSHEDMCAALNEHKRIVASYPRAGSGIDAFVDASDTGYTVQGKPVEEEMQNGKKVEESVVTTNGHALNGFADGLAATLHPIDEKTTTSPVTVAVADGNGIA